VVHTVPMVPMMVPVVLPIVEHQRELMVQPSSQSIIKHMDEESSDVNGQCQDNMSATSIDSKSTTSILQILHIQQHDLPLSLEVTPTMMHLEDEDQSSCRRQQDDDRWMERD
jgi:hypothetical protein